MRFSGLLLALAICVGGAGSLLASNALCGPNEEGGGRDVGGPGVKKGKQGTEVKRSLRMEEIEIYGDVEKPKTMFVIPRSALQYNRKEQEKDFTSEILDPITKERIEDTQRWRVAVPPP